MSRLANESFFGLRRMEVNHQRRDLLRPNAVLENNRRKEGRQGRHGQLQPDSSEMDEYVLCQMLLGVLGGLRKICFVAFPCARGSMQFYFYSGCPSEEEMATGLS